MVANYHTHTARCRHAYGTEREYVEKAIARGLKILGFSDHTPQWFPGDYYSNMRIFPEELDDYCNTIRTLQKEYKGQIDLLLGLEVEYYPATWQNLLPRLQDAGIEYMILGQHNTGNEYDTPHNTIETDDVSLLTTYCDQVITAMETGRFTYFAHPDFINFVGDHKTYETQMGRICKASLETDTPLEINFNGIRFQRFYPNPIFWRLAAEAGCKVVFGYDAHCPDDVMDKASESIALSMVKDLGLNLQQTVPLKSI